MDQGGKLTSASQPAGQPATSKKIVPPPGWPEASQKGSIMDKYLSPKRGGAQWVLLGGGGKPPPIGFPINALRILKTIFCF